MKTFKIRRARYVCWQTTLINALLYTHRRDCEWCIESASTHNAHLSKDVNLKISTISSPSVVQSYKFRY